MQVKLITTDGETRKINIKSFQDAKHQICGEGYLSPIEILTMSDGKLLLLDEEGKLKNLPFNENATKLAHEKSTIYPSDYIVGNVIIVDDVDEFDALSYKE